MELRDYGTALRRHRFLALAASLLVLAAGAVPLLLAQPVYVGRAGVALEAGAGGTPRDLADGVDLVLTQVPALARLVRQPSVLEPAGASLEPPVDGAELGRATSVEARLDSPVVIVLVEAGDPVAAAERADAVAGQLVRAVGQVTPSGSVPGLGVSASVLSTPQPPRVPVAPRRGLTVLVTAVAAVLAAVVVAAVADAPARRRRSPAPTAVPPLVGGGTRPPRGMRGARRARGRRRPAAADPAADVGGVPAEVAASGARAVAVCALGRPRRRRPDDEPVVRSLVAALRARGAGVLVLDAGPVPVGRRARSGRRVHRREGATSRSLPGELGRLLVGTARLGEVVRAGEGPSGADLVRLGTDEALPRDLDPVALRQVVGEALQDYDVVVLRSPAPSTPRGLALVGAADEVLLVSGGAAARQEVAAAAASLGPAGPRSRALLVG